MNKVIDKGFRSCRFVSTIVKHPVSKQLEVEPCQGCSTNIKGVGTHSKHSILKQLQTHFKTKL